MKRSLKEEGLLPSDLLQTLLAGELFPGSPVYWPVLKISVLLDPHTGPVSFGEMQYATLKGYIRHWSKCLPLGNRMGWENDTPFVTYAFILSI
jgi:hypothetical protein